MWSSVPSCFPLAIVADDIRGETLRLHRSFATLIGLTYKRPCKRAHTRSFHRSLSICCITLLDTGTGLLREFEAAVGVGTARGWDSPRHLSNIILGGRGLPRASLLHHHKPPLTSRFVANLHSAAYRPSLLLEASPAIICHPRSSATQRGSAEIDLSGETRLAPLSPTWATDVPCRVGTTCSRALCNCAAMSSILQSGIAGQMASSQDYDANPSRRVPGSSKTITPPHPELLSPYSPYRSNSPIKGRISCRMLTYPSNTIESYPTWHYRTRPNWTALAIV
jgi:hypothetical protein